MKINKSKITAGQLIIQPAIVVPNADADYYELLGIDDTASNEEVARAWKKMAHRWHPDRRGGDAQVFARIADAYKTLGDAKRRAFYDATCAAWPEEAEIKEKATALGVSFLMAVCENLVAEKGLPDNSIWQLDPVAQAENAIKAKLDDTVKSQKALTKQLARMKEITKRFSKKTPEFAQTIFGIRLLATTQEMRQSHALMGLDTEVLKLALKLLKTYGYEIDSAPKTPAPNESERRFTNRLFQGFVGTDYFEQRS